MIALSHDNDTRLSDLVRTDDKNIGTDEGLETAVFISLFTRRRAPDEALPDPLSENRQGWWADKYPDVENDFIGSRLWLLARSKSTQNVMNTARTYIEEALQWLIEDEVAESVTVEVERHGNEKLAFKVEILKPTKPASRWIGTWEAHLEEL